MSKASKVARFNAFCDEIERQDRATAEAAGKKRECIYIDPETGFHRNDTPIEQDGSCCGCGMI